MSRTCIEHTFNKARAFLPVIHLPYGVKGGLKAVDVAMRAGADGVFLINQGMNAKGVKALAKHLRDSHKGLWVGINILGEEPENTVLKAGAFPPFDGLWVDDCGVDPRPVRRDGTWENTRDLWQEARDTSHWRGGLYFGGTAFKTQMPITDPAVLAQVARNAATFVDVVLTSGEATGVAAPIEKVRVMREALGPMDVLGLASGVTPKNVAGYLPYVDAYLVASGIESSFGILDPFRTRDLAQVIHS